MGCLCYFALFVTIYFTVQVNHSSISDFKVFPNFLCVHMFHGNTVCRDTLFFFVFLWKNCYLLSQHSKRQSLSIQREVEPDWSPGFARDYQAASILVGEASCTKSN